MKRPNYRRQASIVPDSNWRRRISTGEREVVREVVECAERTEAVIGVAEDKKLAKEVVKGHFEE